ncbi:VWA domain-containing protein [Candidatus Woesearchaeota archaeon]|nr:VWA domain-containing protein [Candidatus Woesearchaeota archaeon]
MDLGITNLLEPEAFLLLIPVLFIFMLALFKNFVSAEIGDKRERRRFRIFILLIRGFVFLLIVTALAKPFGEVTVTTQGDPKITILVDESASMEVVDTSFMPNLKKELEREFPVTIKQIGSSTKSDLGEEILSYLEKDTNILLVTDGHSNSGASLEEVALLAANLNSTLSAMELRPKTDEAGVHIIGPDNSVKGVNNTFIVRVVDVKGQDLNLRVIVDNEEIRNSPLKNTNEYAFIRNFDEGNHRIVAEVTSAADHFPQNNRFYKEVSVVKKPKILLVQDSYDPVEQIFRELYDVTKTSSIPEDVGQYYAVILNDMPADTKGVERLADYLIDKEGGYYGNGLFVIGGFDSFDRGGYKGSILESYLPVTVGKAARRRGSSNIAMAIDFSGTTGVRYDVIRDPATGKILDLKQASSNIQDVNKALAVSIIKSLGPDNTVGVSIFSTQSATVQELAPLFQVKESVIDKISRIQQPAGQSYFNIGLSGAYLLLKDHVGSNNIILITDGQTGSEEVKKATIDTAKTLNQRGVKVYVAGTGRNVNENFLKDVAYNGGGIYFPADQSNNLKVLFGEPSESKFGEVFDLFILNQYHFITQGLALDASLYGFNQVIPKPNSLSLITTQHGEPAVTVWNYGLGRVAALNVFSGNNNLGDILNKKNSILLTRMTNWAIGDPQRKEDYYVVIPDARINNPVDVIVKSSKFPETDGFSLTKVGENQYKTTIIPEETGFGSILGREYAVNYEQEYQELGLNPSLEVIISLSGGRTFSPDDAGEIVKFVKSVSKRTRTERTTIIWPFLLAAAILFLAEIFMRKMREHTLNR